MRSVTHREMRNQSGEILRAVATGETIQVTNGGSVAAIIGPPGGDPLDDLVSRGQAKAATKPLNALLSIEPRNSSLSSAEILDDARGQW